MYKSRIKKLYNRFFPHNRVNKILKQQQNTGGKTTRGFRISNTDPDDSNQTTNNDPSKINSNQTPQESKSNSTAPPPTLGSTRKFSQKVSTISQNYNEKSMLLSSDEEYQ